MDTTYASNLTKEEANKRCGELNACDPRVKFGGTQRSFSVEDRGIAGFAVVFDDPQRTKKNWNVQLDYTPEKTFLDHDDYLDGYTD